MNQLEKVLVTGASGFIGSNLIKGLVKKDFFINALIDKDLGNLKEIYDKNKKKIKIIKGDILNAEKIKEALQDVGLVFHLAGISSANGYADNPNYFFEINAEGTRNLLENSRNRNIKKIIIASSSLVYADSSEKINEEGKTKLTSPYSQSKREAELIALKEYNKNKLPVLIVRLFNIYGEGQSTKAVIPKLICQAINKEEICINCAVEKDFTYIDDAVDALIRLSQTNHFGEIINLGSGKPTSLYQLSKVLEKEFGRNLNIKYKNQDDPKETFICDNSKIKKLISWSAEIDIEEGIKKTIKYIQSHKDQYFIK